MKRVQGTRPFKFLRRDLVVVVYDVGAENFDWRNIFQSTAFFCAACV
jgi:hypothetical protein